MGRATFVTLDMLTALQGAEIEAGLRGDADGATVQFDRGEALTRAAVAQTPDGPEQAVELLRIAQWLLRFSEHPEPGEALEQALAAIEVEGLSGRALHFVRLAGEHSVDDPFAEQALASFWRGLRTRRVDGAEAAGAGALARD
ncbi:MAG: hypothetical protein KF904_20085 [Rhodoblastus sp.]|nr:hypothetical protein [Rhodoblastus sp.]MCC2100988.1 hypothetical protein [Hyphomicrobiales bacterium]